MTKKSTIKITHNLVQDDRIKHIKVGRHFIKEKLDSDMICTPYVSSQDQISYILTKGLNNNNFERIICKLRIKKHLFTSLRGSIESFWKFWMSNLLLFFVSY